MNAAHQWQLVSRADCSLCDTMLMELAQVLGDDIMQVQVIDIGEDTELERKYGSRIPVLLIDGEFVCAYQLDRERVAHYLTAENLPI